MPGVHRVRRRLANGNHAEYWYAWRGGPVVLKASGETPQKLQQQVLSYVGSALAAYKEAVGPRTDGKLLAGLVTAYLSSANFTRLADRTQRDYRSSLDVVKRDLGSMELNALASRRARSVLITWRDKYQDTPKTADSRLGSLALVLQWAKDRGDIPTNPLTDWPRLYRVNRAEMIWTAEALALLSSHISSQAGRDAIEFAACTGLRLGDLVKLPWSAVGQHAIVWQTGKSRGRRTVVIPITDELRTIIDRLPKSEVTTATTVLTNSRRRPWTAWGLQSTLQKAKQLAADDHRKATGDPLASGPLDNLRFHDLRGTGATRLIAAGLGLDDVALIMGWERRKVEAIAARYVTSEAIGLAIVERMRRAQARG